MKIWFSDIQGPLLCIGPFVDLNQFVIDCHKYSIYVTVL